MTPFEALFGRQARLPQIEENMLDRLTDPQANEKSKTITEHIRVYQEMAKINNKAAKEAMKINYDKTAGTRDFPLGTEILLKVKMRKKGRNPKLADKFYGPFVILEKISDVNYKIQELKNKRDQIVHVNRMKIFRRRIESEPIKTEIQKIWKHRYRNRKLQYLIAKTGEPEHTATWVAETQVDPQTIAEYETNKEDRRGGRKPTKPKSNNVRENPKRKESRLRIGVQQLAKTIIICGILLILIRQNLGEVTRDINIGKIYDCSVATHEGVYANNPSPSCKDTKKLRADKTKGFGRIYKYQQQVVDIKIYQCTSEEITLTCQESFWGIEHKSKIKRNYKISEQKCKRMALLKISPGGKLQQIDRNTWVSSTKNKYSCSWLKTKRISIVRFTLKRFKAQVVDTEEIIDQKITETRCYYSRGNCRPQESPKSLLIWKQKKYGDKMFKDMGKHKIQRLHDYYLIPTLGIGGSVIKETDRAILLDIGYLIVQGNKTETNKTFEKTAKEYVTKTKANVQRELSNAKIINELIFEDKWIEMILKLECITAQQIRLIQNFIMAGLPDIADEFLFPNEKGKIIEKKGDAIEIYKCQSREQYFIHWNRRMNRTCFQNFPVTLSDKKRTYFLDLNSRRLGKLGIKTNCSNKQDNFYVRDITGKYWRYDTNNNSFEEITPKHIHKEHKEIRMKKLKGFDRNLLHYKKEQTHRLALLDIIQRNKQTFQEMEDITTESGGFLSGISNAIASSVETVGGMGLNVIETLSSEARKDVETIVHGSDEIISTTSKGIGHILGKLGISNIITFVLIILIIAYLVLMRIRPNGTQFLFHNPGEKHNKEEEAPPEIPPRVSRI